MQKLFDILLLPIRAPIGWMMSLIAAPRRLLGMSLAARVAWLVAIFLIIAAIAAIVIYFLQDSERRPDLLNYFTLTFLIGVPLLMIVIPIVVYWAVRLWLEGEASDYPDIDYAWKTGLEELARHDLNLPDLPIFLIVGVGSHDEAATLMDSSQYSFRVKNVPEGPAALHWFANPDACFIVCTETTRLSAVRRLADRGGTSSALPEAAGNPRDTIVAGGESTDETARISGSRSDADEPEPAAPAGIRGTLEISPMAAGAISETAGGGMGKPVGKIELTSAEASAYSARLEYVCRLIGKSRQPVCPINGILSVLPFALIKRGSGEAREVQRAAREDLHTIRRSLKLRCPVLALITGMETEPGFGELTRRVGRDRAKAQRFGKGANHWSPPIPDLVEAVATHACGAFEDWAYVLFRERDGLTKRHGNAKLYSLLGEMRTRYRRRITDLLVDVYGYDSTKDEHEPLLFSGCYFAATGEMEDRQAFVRSVFERLVDQEAELEWTAEAMADDNAYHRLARLAYAMTGILAVVLIGFLVFYFMLGTSEP